MSEPTVRELRTIHLTYTDGTEEAIPNVREVDTIGAYSVLLILHDDESTVVNLTQLRKWRNAPGVRETTGGQE